MQDGRLRIEGEAMNLYRYLYFKTRRRMKAPDVIKNYYD